MNQFDEADLQRRIKELDLREKTLAKKEVIFNNALVSTDLKVLEETRKVKTQQLAVLNNQYTILQGKYDKEIIDHKKWVKSSQSEISKIKEQKIKVDKELASSRALLSEKRKTLDELKSDIIEQRSYFKSQEDTAQNTVSEWNTVLQEFSKAISDAHERKATLLKENAQLEQLLQENAIIVERSQDKIIALEDKFSERSSQLRQELQAIMLEISNKKIESEEITKTIEKRERMADIHDKELHIKELALLEKNKTLARKEQRLQSNYGIV